MADKKDAKSEFLEKEPATAGLLIIGDEILKGHTKDTNSYFLLTRLWSLGVKVKAVSVIADDIDEIASYVQDFSSQFTHVLTSGGIGPTHDDVTIKAVGKAFNEQLVHNQQLAEIITKAYDVKHLNSSLLKMAQVPSSTKLSCDVDNKTNNPCLFPLISVHNVHIFPGVPSLLQMLFDNNSSIFSSPTMHFYLQKVYLGVDESLVASELQEVHDKYGDKVHLGSYPEINCPEFKTKLTLESLFPGILARAVEHLIATLPPGAVLRTEYCTSGKATTSGMVNDVEPALQFEKTYLLLSADDVSNLSSCVKGAWAVLQETLVQYSLDELCISFNGGKDCMVLLHIYCAAIMKKYPLFTGKLNALYVQVDSPFVEAEEFISACAESYSLNVITIKAGIKKALESLKVSHPGIRAILMGSRKHDPYSDQLTLFSSTDPGWPEYMRINPILNWDYFDVWSVLRGCNIPYLCLYDQGYTSIGGIHNTKRNPALKLDDGNYKPAYMLDNASKERDGRI